MAITLRTGDIVRADPVKKLYKVVYAISPYLEEYAVPVNGLHTLQGTSGITYCESYAVGDHVLYVCPDISVAQETRVCWIVGKVPKDVPYEDIGDEWALSPEYGELTAGLYPVFTEAKQDDGYLNSYSARGNFPVDVTTGDYNLVGENTILRVGDYNTIIRAGEAELLLDSILGVITQNSNLYNRYTLAESTRTQLYNGKLVYTKKLTGDLKEGQAPSDIASFPYREQFSDLLYGHREEILDSINRPIVQINKNLDGSLDMIAARSISLKRSVFIPNYRLNVEESLILGGDLPEPKKDDVLAPIKELPEWSGDCIIDGSDNILDTILAMAGDGDWEAPDSSDEVSFKDTYLNEEHKVAKATAGIDINDDGSVVIRDAWGSELIMSHGNVQISAANNLTTVAGRDKLSIVSGVSAVNAGRGIELGTSAGDVVIGCADGLRVSGKNVSLSADNMTEYIKNEKVSKYTSIYSEANRSESRFNGYASIVANSIQIAGESRCIISSNSCGLSLAANAITMGASIVDIHSNLRISKGKYTIKDVPTVDYNTHDIVVQPTDTTIQVGGTIVVDGNIHSNGWIQTVDGLYAGMVAAKNVANMLGGYGIFKLKHAPKKQGNLHIKDDVSYEFGAKADILKRLKGIFTDKLINDMTRVFRNTSKAFKIIQPLFSIRGGKTNVTPATCSGNSGKVSYIYPGKDFWVKDGLVTVQSNKDITISGCTQLSLNSPNSIKED